MRSTPDFDRLDPRLFRAFLAAAATENFTAAAKKTAMTQSGVSQQIAKLEEQLGVALFKRINKSVVLTDAGKELAAYVETYLDGVEALVEKITSDQTQLKGRVTYAMPNSCLLSPHLGMLLDKRRVHPDIEINITICPDELVEQHLLDDEIDFGFVTRRIDHPALAYRKFCFEEYILVSEPSQMPAPVSPEKLSAMRFVTYPGMDLYFDAWMQRHLPKAKLSFESLQIFGRINNIAGAITMCKHGLGGLFVPWHCVVPLLESGELVAANSSKRTENQIYIVSITGHRPTRRVKQVIDWFLEMHP